MARVKGGAPLSDQEREECARELMRIWSNMVPPIKIDLLAQDVRDLINRTDDWLVAEFPNYEATLTPDQQALPLPENERAFALVSGKRYQTEA